MDKTLFTLLVCAWHFLSILGYAQQDLVSDPEKDYVTSTHLPDRLQARGDDVYRLDLKLAKDDPPTVFLSFKGKADRSGQIWTAYSPLMGGYQRIDNTSDGNLIQFRPDLVAAGEYPGLAANGGLLILYPGKGGGNLIRYNIKDGMASSQQLRVLNYQVPEDKKIFESIFRRDVDKPLPAEYFAAPPYQVLSAKEVRARSPKALPERAPPAPPTPIYTSTPAPATSVPSAPPAASPQPATHAAEIPTPVIERKALVWPWVVGTLALLIMVTVALKRRT